ncbi:pilus (MSHA type) biogenesis protein MshL [Helicobacter burdigaliensis]|uniref:pilus (MSHA type) biogenesis protein MshL n=1 Tax=Helicobacter burdigaliensis TaxID=2315334 RepID=UPI000EF64655|nr:pilus (MSHA type) biogenesis protein MshL [Helicobacter burdigaliensis]
MKIFLLFFSFLGLIFSCENRVFDLHIEHSQVSIQELLTYLAKECSFSVVYDEEGIIDRLDKKLPIVNIKKGELDYIFDLLFSIANLHYSYENNKLELNILQTKTFKINYLGTNREGSSSTSVLINKDSKEQNFNETGTQGFSKSGVDITSYDGFNFWENIKQELEDLLGENVGITINKGAGLISIKGEQKQLKLAKTYMDTLHKRLQAQVMIDVQILSILHNDTNTTGINWEGLYGLQNINILGANENPNLGGEGNLGNSSGINIIGGTKASKAYGLNIVHQGLSLNEIIKYLQTYGEVTSISNPKILTLNNQPAMISVGDILRYKKSTIYQNTNAQTTLTNKDSEYPSIFAGVLLDITPLIFGNEVILKINPSITKTKENRINLPTLVFETPPNLTTNQLSSMIKVKDKEKIILGGLISNIKSQKQNKIPLLGDLPLLSYVFSYSQSIQNKEEIVFIIEPKIIHKEPPTLKSLGYEILKD